MSATNQAAPHLSATPPDPDPVSHEPPVSIQTQIGLVVTALLATLGFIFHSDLGSLAEPLGVLALAVYGSAAAIARAMKHRTSVNAHLALQDQKLQVWQVHQETTPRQAIQSAFSDVAQHNADIEQRLAALEAASAPKPAKKAARRPVKTATRARKASGPRKSAASR